MKADTYYDSFLIHLLYHIELIEMENYLLFLYLTVFGPNKESLGNF